MTTYEKGSPATPDADFGGVGLSKEEEEERKRNAQPGGGAEPAPGAGIAKTDKTAAPGAPAPTPGAVPTFTDLQKAGQPRPPAPPTVAPPSFGAPVAGAPVAGGATVAGGTGIDLGAQLRRMLENPTSYGTAAFNAEMDREGQGIDDEFDARNTGLREDALRRGLSESSILGGRLADSNVGRRSAKSDMATQLMIKRAEKESEGMGRALALALGYESDIAGQNLTREQMAQQGRQWQAGHGLERERLAESRAGREWDQGFRGTEAERAARQFAQSLGLDTRRFESEEARSNRAFTYGQGRDTIEDTYRSGRDTANDTWRAEDRTYARDRDRVGDEYVRGRDTIEDTYRDREANRDYEYRQNQQIADLWERFMRDYFGRPAGTGATYSAPPGTSPGGGYQSPTSGQGPPLA